MSRDPHTNGLPPRTLLKQRPSCVLSKGLLGKRGMWWLALELSFALSTQQGIAGEVGGRQAGMPCVSARMGCMQVAGGPQAGFY